MKEADSSPDSVAGARACLARRRAGGADGGDGAWKNGTDRSAASTRAVEIGVAAVILLFGLVVVTDSYRLGARWATTGPSPATFPST